MIKKFLGIALVTVWSAASSAECANSPKDLAKAPNVQKIVNDLGGLEKLKGSWRNGENMKDFVGEFSYDNTKFHLRFKAPKGYARQSFGKIRLCSEKPGVLVFRTFPRTMSPQEVGVLAAWMGPETARRMIEREQESQVIFEIQKSADPNTLVIVQGAFVGRAARVMPRTQEVKAITPAPPSGAVD